MYSIYTIQPSQSTIPSQIVWGSGWLGLVSDSGGGVVRRKKCQSNVYKSLSWNIRNAGGITLVDSLPERYIPCTYLLRAFVRMLFVPPQGGRVVLLGQLFLLFFARVCVLCLLRSLLRLRLLCHCFCCCCCRQSSSIQFKHKSAKRETELACHATEAEKAAMVAAAAVATLTAGVPAVSVCIVCIPSSDSLICICEDGAEHDVHLTHARCN